MHSVIESILTPMSHTKSYSLREIFNVCTMHLTKAAVVWFYMRITMIIHLLKLIIIRVIKMNDM